MRLTAETARISVGGYSIVTENYNRTYLTPVVEAMPGDTVSARLENALDPRTTDDQSSALCGVPGENPTNLHYFHGGIVTPNNSRPPIDASQGNGDNVYVRLLNGRDSLGRPNGFDFMVPIPGDNELDARVLEGQGSIRHPYGLNWYHSHMHGISSTQVMGGLSGLLSVGGSKANVRAACDDGAARGKCDEENAALQAMTDVRYVLLRDISLRSIGALPEQADGTTKAEWAPLDRDFAEPECPVWTEVDGTLAPNSHDRKLRRGFCQRDQHSAWLFTLNGQRFPTITAAGGRNLLLRVGNLSANVAYLLELYDEQSGETVPLTILSLDGVVPARPVDSNDVTSSVDAFSVDELLLMPAARAEVYIRNDQPPGHQDPQVLILRTKGVDAGSDKWPEIQLARVVLQPTTDVNSVALALNRVVQTAPSPFDLIQDALSSIQDAVRAEPPLPQGCVRDLEDGEHRRVTFGESGESSGPRKWTVATELVHAPGEGLFDESEFEPDRQATIGSYEFGLVKGVPFEDYVLDDGNIDWLGTKHRHVCVRLDHEGSHQQLWVLHNPTSALHNFHIHQMKFRLATRKDLEEKYRIKPPKQSHTCQDVDCAPNQPDFKFYEENEVAVPTAETSEPVWHDTIPVPNGPGVFIVMSFDARQQLGRFVYHCHVLKHEDEGLMTPIEVWDPSS